MSYHIEDARGPFNELPERILMREDGYLGAYKFHGEPIVDYWYVPIGRAERLKTENAELRDERDRMYKANVEKNNEILQLLAENAKLREGLAVSIPLPLDGNRSAIHPDDIIGNNFGGTDFFGKVTEMHLTRYPRDGQPAMWVVKTEDDDGNVTPYVCWGGRCHAVHKKASQTYSAEYLDTYDENKKLKAENAKLRKELVDIHALHWNGLDCTECPWFDECDTTGGCPWLGILADHMRELGIEV